MAAFSMIISKKMAMWLCRGHFALNASAKRPMRKKIALCAIFYVGDFKE